MASKGPLALFLFSLAYLIITLVFFGDSLGFHRTRASQHDNQGEKNAANSKNQSRHFNDNRGQQEVHESRHGSVAAKVHSAFSREQTPDPIPFDTRAYWMRQANAALWQLSSPCPFAAFGSVVVNHTSTHGLGDLVCMGVNSMTSKGNPTLHGEIAAINNCTSVLTATLSRQETLEVFKSLSLYTNGEPCPMCASAIRWAGFKECIYGTTIDMLTAKGWDQIQVYSHELFERSITLPSQTRLIGEILTNETDPYFSWQFDESHACPEGCTREYSGTCEPVWSILER